MKITPVILCGGAGTRLWAQSKKNLPKQFVDWGGWTLFEKTLGRVKSSIFDYPVITTNVSYLKQVKKFLKKHRIKKYKIWKNQILWRNSKKIQIITTPCR